MMEEEKSLHQYMSELGGGSKIPPDLLEEILVQSAHVQVHNEQLVLGVEDRDDATVYEIGGGKYLLSTTDFFSPMVDEAKDYGKLVAASTLNNIYAMGGGPAFAQAILGWPMEELSAEMASEVMRGAKEVCSQAGVIIAGGHSLDLKEPVFGLSVNGFVEKNHLMRNFGAQAGDLLYLTKPLGIGVMTAALNKGLLLESEYEEMIQLSTHLNRVGEAIAKSGMATAMTDVSGFGLLGHLLVMTQSNELTAKLNLDEVPIVSSAENYLARYIFPKMVEKNWSAYSSKVEGVKGMDMVKLCDPQIGGGLLVAVHPDNKNEFEKSFSLWDTHFPLALIGEFARREGKQVKVAP
ncbi:selenide, water dikinase SelD [Echinicola jeungdonensis]|uniref:Selenide, water dikinase SelD n=1 Tax=Echinicola jeungdonensis TaxID=709343 RepID=A0ABV5J556_9BACT|nr:selenide, water dikinase SelD [Echinicola jeungdonensis]MDN3668632.1 selenide, water dikinase SelD [Echinicola jeungdonensis]